jgi:hypothetical protein
MEEEKKPAKFAPKRPTRCRVKLRDDMRLPIVGGAPAFDAEFDWNLMAAIGTVEGYTVMVGIQQCIVTFYK